MSRKISKFEFWMSRTFLKKERARMVDAVARRDIIIHQRNAHIRTQGVKIAMLHKEVEDLKEIISTLFGKCPDCGAPLDREGECSGVRGALRELS